MAPARHSRPLAPPSGHDMRVSRRDFEDIEVEEAGDGLTEEERAARLQALESLVQMDFVVVDEPVAEVAEAEANTEEATAPSPDEGFRLFGDDLADIAIAETTVEKPIFVAPTRPTTPEIPEEELTARFLQITVSSDWVLEQAAIPWERNLFPNRIMRIPCAEPLKKRTNPRPSSRKRVAQRKRLEAEAKRALARASRTRSPYFVAIPEISQKRRAFIPKGGPMASRGGGRGGMRGGMRGGARGGMCGRGAPRGRGKV